MNLRELTTITPQEILHIDAAMALGVSEATGDAVHLVLRDGERTWTVETRVGQFVSWMPAPANSLTESVHLPISDRIRWFACDSGPGELGLADDRTVVVWNEDRSVAIDLVPFEGPAPTPWEFHTRARASLPHDMFRRALGPARAQPTGLGEFEYPGPPMWLQIDGDGLALHVDWADFLASRSTIRARVDETLGGAMVAIPHQIIDLFLGTMEHAHEDIGPPLTVAIGTAHARGRSADALLFETDSWRLVLWAVDVLVDRWARDVERMLAPFEIGDRDPDQWALRVDGCSIRVRLHSGHPDTIRVSSHLGRGFRESLELLRELGALNAASQDVRFWLEEDTVWAAADLPCTRADELTDLVERVAHVSNGFAPLLAAYSG